MIINSLVNNRGDLELRWLNGISAGKNDSRLVDALFRDKEGTSHFAPLPMGMLPFLTPGLVVSNGEIQTTRISGKQGWAVIEDLSKPEIANFADVVPRALYDLGGHRGGQHRILRYRSRGWTVLIPALELIRFLFLHSRTLADALLKPMGLTELAVTPAPGLYADVQIDFTSQMPRKLLTPEFVREFAWLTVQPEGRKAWDSVRRLSQDQRCLMLDPPLLGDCRLDFRGVTRNQHWLALEITAISGRRLPAEIIRWTHPSECESTERGPGDVDHTGSDNAQSLPGPRHERVRLVDEAALAQSDVNQEVVLLGGKRGEFGTAAEIIKVLRPAYRKGEVDASDDTTRKPRSDAGVTLDPASPPKIVTQKVSMGERTDASGLPPLEVSTLETADWDAIGDLSLLVKALQQIEKDQPDVTLTTSLVYLKKGRTVSYCGDRRRTCLVAVFAAANQPPRVVLDLDHTKLDAGLSGQMLIYGRTCPMSDMEEHIKMMLDGMVDHYGKWNKKAETRLPDWVTVRRLPKLLRMKDRAEDPKYIERWQKRLKSGFFH